MKYVGDISRQDAQVLAERAARARAILEFGVGGSTQVLAQSAWPGTPILAFETDPAWIERTKQNLAALGVRPGVVEFLSLADFPTRCAGRMFDLIFVDGVDDQRVPFALAAWPMLAVGGEMLVHDTRRPHDAAGVLRFLSQVSLEVERVEFNVRASNITTIRKKLAEPWINWNAAEGRTAWMAGYEAPPSDWPSRV